MPGADREATVSMRGEFDRPPRPTEQRSGRLARHDEETS